MLSKVKAYYQRQQFHPNWLGQFVNPFYFARRELSRTIQSLGHYVVGNTLDVGCGTKPYEPFFRAQSYVGLEIDTPVNRERKRADAFYDGGRFPFDDEAFDSVVSSQVLEHVMNVDEFLDEIWRVLRKRGKILLTVPFVWDEHEQPYDFRRYSSFGLRALLGRHGFTVLEQRKSTYGVRAACQLWNCYLYKAVACGKNKYVNLVCSAAFAAPVNVLGSAASLILPGNTDLYLDNVVVAEKVERENLPRPAWPVRPINALAPDPGDA
jgi:SAM-dependent methyltransferase